MSSLSDRSRMFSGCAVVRARHRFGITACGRACLATHLQITVHDAQGVHVTHSTSKLGEDLCSVVLCVSLQCLDTVQQHAASAERQDQEDDTALSIVEGCAARENEVQAVLLCEGRVPTTSVNTAHSARGVPSIMCIMCGFVLWLASFRRMNSSVMSLSSSPEAKGAKIIVSVNERIECLKAGAGYNTTSTIGGDIHDLNGNLFASGLLLCQVPGGLTHKQGRQGGTRSAACVSCHI